MPPLPFSPVGFSAEIERVRPRPRSGKLPKPGCRPMKASLLKSPVLVDATAFSGLDSEDNLVSPTVLGGSAASPALFIGIMLALPTSRAKSTQAVMRFEAGIVIGIFIRGLVGSLLR